MEKTTDIIFIGSGKGGVGKSTITAFLGKSLSEKGKKTLIIDSDSGLGAMDILLKASDKVMNTWLDVSENGCSVSSAAIKITENLFLLPAPRFFPQELNENALKDVVSLCEGEYDCILIDGSAGIDRGFAMCLKAANRCIFVATADEISVKCACSAADRANELGFDAENIRIVINRFEKKAAQKSRLLNIDGVIDKSGVMLLGVVPFDKSIAYSSVTGKYPPPKSRFMKAVDRIARRTDGEYIPLRLD
ncbi:MAG: AAA family ATPase [Clostridiales bacterium]|nr:AAA family ATPase [Clostridiales bacterium]